MRKWYDAEVRGLILIVLISMIIMGSILNIEYKVITESTNKYEPIRAQEVPSDVPKLVKKEVKKPPRYGFTDKEIYLLTVLLCGSGKRDGDGEYDFDFIQENNILTSTHNTQQISLVLNVVMNRVESEQFPDTVSKVVWAQNQFSYMPHWKNGLPKVKPESYEIVEAWCNAYDSYDSSVLTIPASHLYFSGNGMINKSRKRG